MILIGLTAKPCGSRSSRLLTELDTGYVLLLSMQGQPRKDSSQGARENHGLSPQELTMIELLTRMRTGQLSSGTLRPYSWLDLATQPKPEQQLKVEKFFESCSFKSVLSYVVGKSVT